MKAFRLSNKFKGKALMHIHEVAMLPRKVHVALFALSITLSGHAMAAGVTGFFTGWRSGVNALIQLVLLIGMAVGIIAVLYGIIQMIKKGMGRGDDIEWGKIMWPIMGGALATVVLVVIVDRRAGLRQTWPAAVIISSASKGV